MGLYVSDNGGGDFEITPPGMHIARCYMVVELGNQSSTWNDEVKIKRKVRMSFELPNCLMKEGDKKGLPFSVSNHYTISLGKASNLRRDLDGWKTTPFTEAELQKFDLFNMVGKSCMLNVVHNESNGKTFANIASISPLMEGAVCPPMVNKPTTFCIAEAKPGEFEALPDWLKKKINLEIPQTTPQAGETPQQPPQSPHEVYAGADITHTQSTDIANDDIPW